MTPDAWIDHLYAQDMVNLGERGFVLARIGGSNGEPQQVYPAGPWSDHTSTIAFTGDAWGTWNTLAAEAALVPDEATIGEPYVSSDIGSYLGPPPTQSGADPPDLYDRWVQLGTFQPILRLHSNDENRLPWQYPQPVQGITESFLRLREALLPYTYTLAAEANQTGLPMARPLYLDYPDQPSAYQNPTEYLYGPDMLVAPVTTPGDVASTTVWFPPGKWVDFFTGATFTGPSSATLAVPLDQMPVFVRAGWDRPRAAAPPAERGRRTRSPPSSTRDRRVLRPLRRRRNGSRLHQGATLRDPHHHVVEHPAPADRPPSGSRSVPLGAAIRGEPASVATTIEMVDVTRPNRVSVDGRNLSPGTAPGRAGPTRPPPRHSRLTSGHGPLNRWRGSSPSAQRQPTVADRPWPRPLRRKGTADRRRVLTHGPSPWRRRLRRCRPR